MGTGTGEATHPLLPWLVESLIEIACESAQDGDAHRVRAILELCRALGGIPFGSEIINAPSREQSHRGATPVQLAKTHGNVKTKAILADWPNVEAVGEDVFKIDENASSQHGSSRRHRSSSVGHRVRKVFSSAMGGFKVSGDSPPSKARQALGLAAPATSAHE